MSFSAMETLSQQAFKDFRQNNGDGDWQQSEGQVLATSELETGVMLLTCKHILWFPVLVNIWKMAEIF